MVGIIDGIGAYANMTYKAMLPLCLWTGSNQPLKLRNLYKKNIFPILHEKYERMKNSWRILDPSLG